jgi:hypothetical protein
MKRRVLLWLGLLLLVAVVPVCMGEVIQTQPATGGAVEADIIKASVRDSVLTIQVAFRCTGGSRVHVAFKFGDVYLTDLKEKKKYFPLKDSSGKYLAGPAANWLYGGMYNAWMKPGDRFIFWIKFPAPPATTQTVDVMVPGFLPLEDVLITRR